MVRAIEVSISFLCLREFRPVVPIIGSGKERIQPVFVQDLAEAVYFALNDSNAYGQVYEVGGPQELTMMEIVRTMLRVQGKHRLILPHPKPLMKILASFMQFLPGRPLTPGGVDFVTMEEKVDTSKLLDSFPIVLTPLADGLGKYMGGLRERHVHQRRRSAVY